MPDRFENSVDQTICSKWIQAEPQIQTEVFIVNTISSVFSILFLLSHEKFLIRFEALRADTFYNIF